MALRLAACCGKLDDVDGMLSRMTPEQFNEVVAYNSIEPLWTERLCQLIAMLGAVVSKFAGSDDAAELFRELVSGTEPESDKPQIASPEQAAQFLRSVRL